MTLHLCQSAHREPHNASMPSPLQQASQRVVLPQHCQKKKQHFPAPYSPSRSIHKHIRVPLPPSHRGSKQAPHPLTLRIPFSPPRPLNRMQLAPTTHHQSIQQYLLPLFPGPQFSRRARPPLPLVSHSPGTPNCQAQVCSGSAPSRPRIIPQACPGGRGTERARGAACASEGRPAWL